MMTKSERKLFCDHLRDISEIAYRKGDIDVATAVTIMATCLLLSREEEVIRMLDPIAKETLARLGAKNE